MQSKIFTQKGIKALKKRIITKENITIKIKDIEVKPEDIFLKKVIKSGNGAVINFFKKHINKDVYIILK